MSGNIRPRLRQVQNALNAAPSNTTELWRWGSLCGGEGRAALTLEARYEQHEPGSAVTRAVARRRPGAVPGGAAARALPQAALGVSGALVRRDHRVPGRGRLLVGHEGR